MTRHRANNCSNPDRLRDLLDPESRTIIHLKQQVKARTPRVRTIIRSGHPGWAGARKRTMAVFCGFAVPRSPKQPGNKPEARSLGEPEPDCPRHPRKFFLLICGFYATMFYRIWVVMGFVRYFHAFMGKFLKFL